MSKNIIVILSEKQWQGLQFYNQIQPITKKDQFMKKHPTLNFYIYLAYSLEENSIQNPLDVVQEINHDCKDGNIIAYFFIPPQYLQHNHQPKFDKQLKEKTQGKLFILYDCQNQTLLEAYKIGYNSKQIFHMNKFLEVVKQLLNEPKMDIKFINMETALLIGVHGAGKTKLYQKATGNTDSNSGFQSKVFQEQEFQLVDCPSLQLDENVAEREKQIKQFVDFFAVHQSVVSTFFLILKAEERLDNIKTNFTAVFTKFSAFSKQIVVLVNSWELVDEQQKLDSEQALKQLFLKIAKVKSVHFLTNEITQQDLLHLMKSELTGQKGIKLNGTFFEIESSKEQQQIDVNIQKSVPDQKKISRKQIQQDLHKQEEQLDQEIEQHAQQIQQISQQLNEKLRKKNSIRLQLNQLNEESEKQVISQVI